MPDSLKTPRQPKRKPQSDEAQRIMQLYHSVSAGILYLNRDLIVQSINRPFSQALGHPNSSSLVGCPISALIQDSSILEAIQQAVVEGQPAILFGDRQSGDQQTRDLWQWSIQPTRDDQSTVSGVLVHLIDLTDHIDERANPQQLETRLHKIIHNAPLILSVIDRSGRIIICEGSELESLGFDADELVGRSIYDVIPHRADIRKLLERALAGEDFQTEVSNSKGVVFAVQFQAYRNAHNEIIGVICNALNITTSKKYEQDLQRSEELFRTAVENMYDPFVLFSTIRDDQGKTVDFIYEYANQAALKANGTNEADLLGKRLLDVMPKHLGSGLFEQYCRVMDTGDPLILEDLFHEDTIAGYPISGYFDVRATRVADKLAYTWRNVTERKLYQDQLIRQQRLLSTVLETLPVGIWLTDSRGNITRSNPAGRAIWGGDPAIHIDQTGKDPAWPDSSQPLETQDCALARAIIQGIPSLDETIEIDTLDHAQKTIQISTIPLRDADDGISGALVVHHDITPLKQVENELIEAKHQLQKGIENERIKLAKELHDGPLQTMLAASYMLEDRNGQPASPSAVTEAQQIVFDVIERLRKIYGKLRPVTVAHYGLVKAIRFLMVEFQKKHPKLTIQQEFEEEVILPEMTRLIVFRCFKELLANIEQHSHAQAITVRLRSDEEWVILEVNDDGSGFTFPTRWVDFAHEGHLGLLAAKESIEAIGGYLVIDSTPNAGTRVRILARRFLNPCAID